MHNNSFRTPEVGQSRESSTPEETHDLVALKRPPARDQLLTVEQVAERLNVSKDWVWDHSSRKTPLLPVIRMSDGTLRYRSSKIEDFINDRERLTSVRLRRVK